MPEQYTKAFCPCDPWPITIHSAHNQKWQRQTCHSVLKGMRVHLLDRLLKVLLYRLEFEKDHNLDPLNPAEWI